MENSFDIFSFHFGAFRHIYTQSVALNEKKKKKNEGSTWIKCMWAVCSNEM